MSDRINYPAPQTTDLVKDAQSWRIRDTLARTQLFDGYTAGLNGFGIVDSRDPSTSVDGSTRPLTVSSSGSTLAITIRAGTVLFGNGEMITLPELVGLTVPSVYLGERHVVYLVFTEEGHQPRYGDDDVQINTWIGQLDDPRGYVRIDRLTSYNAQALETRRSTFIPLAVVTPTTAGVSVDLTRTELTENRPWATAVDIYHRNQLGSGVVTPRNAHGNVITDFGVAANLSFHDFILPTGMIIAKDTGVAGVPGRLCTETIPALGILDDTLGSVTGIVGAKYFRAGRFPTQILSCVDTATQTIQFGLTQVPDRNILFFLSDDEWTTGMDVDVVYASVDAASPPVAANLTVIEPVQPLDNETIISGGATVPAVTGMLSYATAGAYPFKTVAYLTGDGDMRRMPETIKCDIMLTNAIGTQAVEISPIVPSRLRVGLRGAIASPSMVVAIEITGTRVDDGAVVTETVTFDSTWTDSVIPSTSENASQWRTTATTFTGSPSWRVLTRTNDGPNSAITIQALTDPNDLDLANSLSIAEIFWDGLRFSDVRDVRKVQISATSVPQYVHLAASTIAFSETSLLRSPAVTKAVVGGWYDDFDYPKWVGTVDTTLSRWSDGAGASDIYTSRPIPVRPHTSNGLSLRVQPIETQKGFNMWVRVFTKLTNAWSAWLQVSSLADPKYTYTMAPGDGLIKWQFRVQGPCKGMLATYLAETDNVPSTFVFDVGAFGIDTLG